MVSDAEKFKAEDDKQKERKIYKTKYPHWDEDRIEKIVNVDTPGLRKRIVNTVQTFISFVPGLSWIPLPKELSYAIGEDYTQTILRRKLYELCGENIPQFILQLSIKLDNSEVSIRMMFNIVFNFASDGVGLTSIGLTKRCPTLLMSSFL